MASNHMRTFFSFIAIFVFTVFLASFAAPRAVAQESLFEIDPVATARAPWKGGDIVFIYYSFEGSGHIERRFLGINTSGQYLARDYYFDTPTRDGMEAYDAMPESERYPLFSGILRFASEEALVSAELGLLPGDPRIRHPESTPEGEFKLNAYRSDSLFLQGQYQQGLAEGLWITWYANDCNQESERHYHNGVPQGT